MLVKDSRQVPFWSPYGAFGAPIGAWEGSWPSTAPRGADIGFDLAGHSQDGRRGGRGGVKWFENRAQRAPPKKKHMPKTQKLLMFLKSSKNQCKHCEIEPFQGLHKRPSDKILGSLFELRFGTLLIAFFSTP